MNINALNTIFQQKFGITLTPQELQELTTVTDTNGRSPFRARQLTDLRLLPRADDPRPTFFSTTEVPREWNTTTQHEYPKLMWSPGGTEVVIHPGKEAESEEQAFEARGYVHTPPATQTPLDAVSKEMAQLSDEDRQFVLEMQRKTRMSRLEERLASLSDDELAQIAAEPAKMGVGRPKKTA
jgi:hypothetical protein